MATTTRARSVNTPVTAPVGRRILAGLIGGIAGGLVFGILMAMMGLLPVLASMVGSDSALLGFGIHMMISVVFGLGFTVLFGNALVTSYPRGLLFGMAYGAVWWVMGPLVIMPMMLGMPLFTVDTTALFALMGHVIYGAILGAVAAVFIRRR